MKLKDLVLDVAEEINKQINNELRICGANYGTLSELRGATMVRNALHMVASRMKDEEGGL